MRWRRSSVIWDESGRVMPWISARHFYMTLSTPALEEKGTQNQKHKMYVYSSLRLLSHWHPSTKQTLEFLSGVAKEKGWGTAVPPWHGRNTWILLQWLIPHGDLLTFLIHLCTILCIPFLSWSNYKLRKHQRLLRPRLHGAKGTSKAPPILRAKTQVTNPDPGELAAEVIKHHEITGTTISGILGTCWESLQQNNKVNHSRADWGCSKNTDGAGKAIEKMK